MSCGCLQDNGNSEVVLPKVPFSACLAKWAGEEVMADYFSAAVGHKTQAKRFSRIANFPPYLMLQMNRSVLPCPELYLRLCNVFLGVIVSC